jgi:ATP-dependent RNA helicase DDX3X
MEPRENEQPPPARHRLKVTQRVVWCAETDKCGLMTTIVRAHCTTMQPPDRVIVLVNKKATADVLWQHLNSTEAMPCAILHGDRRQVEREEAMASFKRGATPVLVGTEQLGYHRPLSADHIVLYDFPVDMGTYIHRVGLVGRDGGAAGVTTSFFNESDRPMAAELHAYLREQEQEVPEWLERLAGEANR